MGYELHPRTPAGGAPLSEVLPDAAAMLGYVRSFAAEFGIDDLVPPRVLPSTRRVHAVAQLARDEGRLTRFRVAAFDAYWRRGRGLESEHDLAALAEEVGLDRGAALVAASDPAMLSRVDAARRAAAAAGVTGIPTFDVGDARIVGCQRFEILAEAARRAGAGRRG